jgi:hypothetical protein
LTARFAPCLAAVNNTDGAAVVTQDCSIGTPASRQWTAILGGAAENSGHGPATQIRIHGNKCLDVTNGATASGTKLQIWTCGNGNPNQLWQINGDSTINWAGKNLCLDLTGGSLSNGTRVRYLPFNWYPLIPISIFTDPDLDVQREQPQPSMELSCPSMMISFPSVNTDGAESAPESGRFMDCFPIQRRTIAQSDTSPLPYVPAGYLACHFDLALDPTYRYDDFCILYCKPNTT